MSALTHAPEPPPKVSEARERLLRVASELFYREGIHGVGMDRVLAEAGVTRATMYRHFAGKQALVAAYLELEDQAIRSLLSEAVDAPPREAVRIVIDGIADDIARSHTRGCPFINAAAEYPDPESLVRRIVRGHRDWFRQTLTDVLAAADVDDAAAAAGSLVLLRDAALVGGYLDGVEVARPAFVRTAHRIVGF
jgi:AcrR family transcriptional regulator